jgi:hypothetical protein
MQFKHPEILYFLFLLIVPLLVHLFQFRRFKRVFLTFDSSHFLCRPEKALKKKKWLLLSCRLLLSLLSSLCALFCSKDKENATNEMYIILDNSFSICRLKENRRLLSSRSGTTWRDSWKHYFSLLTNSENFGTDIKSIRSTLQNLQAVRLSIIIMARIKSHKSILKDIIVTDAVGLDAKQLKQWQNDVPYFVIPKAEQKKNSRSTRLMKYQTTMETVDLSHYGADFKPVP